ncbi:MAG: DNA cytosine methyltransferase [Ruminiclostridium sp.]|nr:DNA cytosine methyltransferase [Ruminiclostridium sp.]
MSPENKKEAPQTNPQDKYKNIHKNIITENCGFVKRELVVDNFAGGGGASTGIEQAIGRSVDIAINHDPDAIAMHKVNHPKTKHYCENVWDVDPKEACNGFPVGLAWFSPDCTHFSRAKGGKPVDKNIRGLAWVTLRWAYEVRPRVIMLENVPEIQTWGPLGADGRPIKERAGETFDAFCCMLGKSGYPRNSPAFLEMCEALNISPDSEQARTISDGLGYDVQYRILRSCDYGAPTTRTRFYMIARCDDEPIVFPEPTHGKGRTPYRTAAEIIDWSVPAKSIFERDKPLAENTLKRIARGIKKFVIDNPEPFIIPIGYGERKGQEPRVNSINEPLGTVVGSNKHYVVAPSIIQYHSETSYDEVRGQELTEPLMTVDTSPRYALSVAHIMKNYGGGYKGAGSAADAPLDTVTAKDHNELVTANILTMRNHMDGQRIDAPLGTISCSGAHHAEVQAFLVKYFSTGTAKPVTEPLDTITTKERFGLVTIHGEDYIITDIRMRMLTPRELFRAQGFPESYIIDHDSEGRPYPKSKQVARCGNAVTPPVPCALVRANLPEMCGGEERAAG